MQIHARRSFRVVTFGIFVLVTVGSRTATASPCTSALQYYGTYSVGTKAGGLTVPKAARLRELRNLGANMVVATGDGTEILDLLPDGLLAVPGCGLMQERDWKKGGRWNEGQARRRLATLARKFGRHPRVFGVCLTHEVSEYADHGRRRWMYRLAKEYFPRKKVMHYYGHLYDTMNPERKKVYEYGLRGEVETDILFVSMPATDDGRFAPHVATRRVEGILRDAARTPRIPVWGQTSINADHHYVTGRESMIEVWGRDGENMARWAENVLRTRYIDRAGRELRVTGFFWRSLGRFPHDLGHPDFAAHRAQMRAIGSQRCASPRGDIS